MRKGLYWSQLILGIGIGLILTTSGWIFIKEYYPEFIEPTVQTTVKPEIKREIVYYEYPYYEFETPQLSLPEIDEKEEELDTGKKTTHDPISEPVKETKETKNRALKNIDLELGIHDLISSLIENSSEVKSIEKKVKVNDEEFLELFKKKETDVSDVANKNKIVEKEDEVKEVEKWIEIKISPGEPAWQIARRLDKMGVIEGSEFIKIVDKMNLDKRLRVGTYKLKKDMNTFEVIAELMKINY